MDAQQPIKEYTASWQLTAAECGPEQTMTPPLMVTRLIEVATLHANHLGIGYARLIVDGLAWVLSRVSLEMTRWPRVGEGYTLRTWVEGCNRLFSQRDMEITSTDSGEVLGYARTIWMAIDIERRVAGEIPSLDSLAAVVSDRPCPIEPAPKLREPKAEEIVMSDYTFRYTDLDFNRHVNTVRYIELLLNQKSLEHYDAFVAGRFDIHFHHECRYGQTVELRVESADGSDTFDIVTPDGKHAIVARIKWKEIIE